jgi:O-antigen/teichoic acid export membrane protein
MSDARVRPIVTLLGGNLLGAAVGGAFFLTASWRFDLPEMGRYAVAISVQWVAFGLIGTGVSIATLRFANDRLAANDRAGAAGVVVTSSLAASAASLGLAAVCFLGLRAAGTEAALTPRVAALAVLWAGGRALLDCMRSGLLAQQDFARTALLTSLSAATGLGALAFAAASDDLPLERLLEAHVAGILGGVIASAALLRGLLADGIRHDAQRTRAVFRYARWPALSEGTRLLQANLGPPLLVALAGPGEAGLFGVGRYPAYVFEVVAVTLYQYWLARAVRVPDRVSMRDYLAPQLRLSAVLGVGMVLAALAAQPLLPRLGENFARSGFLFAASAVDFAIVLLVRPLETVWHGLREPRLELLQRGVALPVLLAAALLLAPRWGALGMVGAHVCASLATLAFGSLALRRSLRAGEAS